MHVLDASRAVPVTTSLLSDENKPAFVTQHFAEYAALRKSQASSRNTGGLDSDCALPRRTLYRSAGVEDLAVPEFTGVRVLDNFSLATLREFIDWSPFFHTWGLKGIYPRIFDHAEHGEQARRVFAEGAQCAARYDAVAKNLITARAVYGLFPASCGGGRGGTIHRCHAH